jgi:hypothetical protein
MADSSTNLTQLTSGQANKETTVNELVDSGSPATLFGRNAVTTTGLTWGYFGGRIYIDGTATSISNGTVALTASSTNYVEVDITGAVSKNTTAFSADKCPLYKVVTGGSTITSYEDHRNPMTLLRLFYGRVTIAMGDANKTLTHAQATCESIECTGALTALRDVIVPTVKRIYTVYANTSGGFGVRFKTSAGTGITVADGTRRILECDGTNVVALSAGGDALTSSPLSQFAATTSAQLAGVISNETGSGSLVFGTSPTITTPDIVGTTTNDNASGGSVGEYVSNSATGASLTSTVSANVTSISLTAGDWDVWGSVTYVPSSTMSSITTSISTTSATLNPNTGDSPTMAVAFSSGAAQSYQPTPIRVSISSTTTVYLVANATFASTATANGVIKARRRR